MLQSPLNYHISEQTAFHCPSNQAPPKSHGNLTPRATHAVCTNLSGITAVHLLPRKETSVPAGPGRSRTPQQPTQRGGPYKPAVPWAGPPSSPQRTLDLPLVLPCCPPLQHRSVGWCPPVAPRPGADTAEAAQQMGQKQAAPRSSLGVCFPSALPATVPEKSPRPSALRPSPSHPQASCGAAAHACAALALSQRYSAGLGRAGKSRRWRLSAPASLQRVAGTSTSTAPAPPPPSRCGSSPGAGRGLLFHPTGTAAHGAHGLWEKASQRKRSSAPSWHRQKGAEMQDLPQMLYFISKGWFKNKETTWRRFVF